MTKVACSVTTGGLIGELLFSIFVLIGRSRPEYALGTVTAAVLAGLALQTLSQPRADVRQRLGTIYAVTTAVLYVVNWCVILVLYFLFNRPGFAILAPLALAFCLLLVVWFRSIQSILREADLSPRAATVLFLLSTLVLAVPHAYLEPLQLHALVGTGPAFTLWRASADDVFPRAVGAPKIGPLK